MAFFPRLSMVDFYPGPRGFLFGHGLSKGSGPLSAGEGGSVSVSEQVGQMVPMFPILNSSTIFQTLTPLYGKNDLVGRCPGHHRGAPGHRESTRAAGEGPRGREEGPPGQAAALASVVAPHRLSIN